MFGYEDWSKATVQFRIGADGFVIPLKNFLVESSTPPTKLSFLLGENEDEKVPWPRGKKFNLYSKERIGREILEGTKWMEWIRLKLRKQSPYSYAPVCWSTIKDTSILEASCVAKSKTFSTFCGIRFWSIRPGVGFTWTTRWNEIWRNIRSLKR